MTEGTPTRLSDLVQKTTVPGADQFRAARNETSEVNARQQANRPMREFLQVLTPKSPKELISLGARVASVYNPVVGVAMASANIGIELFKEGQTARKIRHQVEKIIGKKRTNEAEATLKALGVKDEEMFIIFMGDDGKDWSTRFLLDKLWWRQTAIGKVLGKDNQALTNLNPREKKAAMGVAVASVGLGIGLGMAVSKLLERTLLVGSKDPEVVKFGLERLGVMKAWGAISHVLGSRAMGFIGEQVVFKGVERTDENRAKIDEWIKTTMKIVESLNTAWYTGLMAPNILKTVKVGGVDLAQKGIIKAKEGLDKLHELQIVATSESIPTATETAVPSTPTLEATREPTGTLTAMEVAEAATATGTAIMDRHTATPIATAHHTETPTPIMTPPETPPSDFGWQVGEAVDSALLEEAANQGHLVDTEPRSISILEHELQLYGFDLDSDPDRDVLAIKDDQGDYIPVIWETFGGFYKVDIPDDDIGPLNYPGDFFKQEDGIDIFQVGGRGGGGEFTQNLQGGQNWDLDNDGDDDLIPQDDGSWFIDRNDDNTKGAEDFILAEPPVFDDEGNAVKLVGEDEGQVWFKTAQGQWEGIIKASTGQWGIDYQGGNNPVSLSIDVELAERPNLINLIQNNPEDVSEGFRWDTKNLTVNFANGAKWVFDGNGEVEEGIMADGRTLMFDHSPGGKGIMAIQTALANRHPEWTPDQAGGEAANGFDLVRRGLKTLDEVKQLEATQRAETGGEKTPSGEVISWEDLRQDASGGEHGIIQGQLHSQTQLTAQEGVIATGNLSRQFYVGPEDDLENDVAFHQAVNEQVARFALKNELETSFTDMGLDSREALQATNEIMFEWQGDFSGPVFGGTVNHSALDHFKVEIKIGDSNPISWINFDWEEWLKQHGYIK
ncbi:MAG: hypothetical protein U0946_04400 [Patescibacteria group bacterium]|nr:hypothetical protein [Patescibacteria group bacterium]